MTNKATITFKKRRGFAQILLLIALALGISVAGYFAVQHKQSTVLVQDATTSGPEAKEPVVVEADTATASVIEASEPVSTKPQKIAPDPSSLTHVKPVAEMREQSSASQVNTEAVVPEAPTPTPVPSHVVTAPIVVADDAGYLNSLLLKLSTNKEAWIRYSDNANDRRAIALKQLADSIANPAYSDCVNSPSASVQILCQEMRNLYEKLRSNIAAESEEYSAIDERAEISTVFQIFEPTIRTRIATVGTTPLTEAEKTKFEGYLIKIHATVGNVEDSASVYYGKRLDSMFGWINQIDENAGALIAAARQAAVPNVSRP